MNIVLGIIAVCVVFITVAYTRYLKKLSNTKAETLKKGLELFKHSVSEIERNASDKRANTVGDDSAFGTHVHLLGHTNKIEEILNKEFGPSALAKEVDHVVGLIAEYNAATEAIERHDISFALIGRKLTELSDNLKLEMRAYEKTMERAKELKAHINEHYATETDIAGQSKIAKRRNRR